MPNKLFVQPSELPPTAWTVALLGYRTRTCYGLDPLEVLGGLPLVSGFGDGTDYGDGIGDGDGIGYGAGYGHGGGDGRGDDYGDGNGDGYGYGTGHGYGTGDGSSRGGFGYGTGDGNDNCSGNDTTCLVSIVYAGRMWTEASLMEVLDAEQVVHPTE